jgi:hypothetical protein
MINLTDLSDEFAAPASPTKPAVADRLKATLHRISSALVKSRQAEADRLVRCYLAQHDDGQLARMGWIVDEIKVIRSTTASPAHRY